ncbi:MAG TPA: RNA-binding protein [bacterium]|nr:RNA-binding protein [bacterium]
MAKKLYVGGLPYSVNEGSLRELFEPFGELLSVAVISDKFTGQPKGFGFVEFAEIEAADNAIAQVNGKEMGGRTLTVNEAKPQEKRSGGFGGGGGNRGGGFGGGGGRGGFGGNRGGGGGRGRY